MCDHRLVSGQLKGQPQDLAVQLRARFASAYDEMLEGWAPMRVIWFRVSHPVRRVLRVKCLDLMDDVELGWTLQMVEIGRFELADYGKLPEGGYEQAWEEQHEEWQALQSTLAEHVTPTTRFAGAIVRLQGVRDHIYAVEEGKWQPVACGGCWQHGVGFGTAEWAFAGVPCQVCLDDFGAFWNQAPSGWTKADRWHKSIGAVEQARKSIMDWHRRERDQLVQMKRDVAQELKRERARVRYQEAVRLSRLSRLSRLRRRKLRGTWDLTSQLGALSVLAQTKGKT